MYTESRMLANCFTSVNGGAPSGQNHGRFYASMPYLSSQQPSMNNSNRQQAITAVYGVQCPVWAETPE